MNSFLSLKASRAILALIAFFTVLTVSAQDDLTVVSPKTAERLEFMKKAALSLEEKDVLETPFELVYYEALKRLKNYEPSFNENPISFGLIEDVNNWATEKSQTKAKEEFPDLDMEAIQAKAVELFPAYTEGMKVEKAFAQNPVRPLNVKGRIRTITATHVKIGLRSYLIADFAAVEFRDGLSVAKTKENRDGFVAKEQKKLNAKRNIFIEENFANYYKEAISKNESLNFLWDVEKKAWVKGEPIFRAKVKQRIERINAIVTARLKAAEEKRQQAELLRLEKEEEARLLAEKKAAAAAEEAKKAAAAAKLEVKVVRIEEDEADKLAEKLEREAQEKQAAEAARIEAEAIAKKKYEATQARLKKEAEAKKAAEDQELLMIVVALIVLILGLIFALMNPKIRAKLIKPKKKVELNEFFQGNGREAKSKETSETEEEPSAEGDNSSEEVNASKKINFVRSDAGDEESSADAPVGLKPPGQASDSSKLTLTPPGSAPMGAVTVEDDEDEDDKDSLILNPNLKVGDKGKIQLKK